MFVNLNLKISLWILVEFSLIFLKINLLVLTFFNNLVQIITLYCNKDTFYPLRRFLV